MWNTLLTIASFFLLVWILKKVLASWNNIRKSSLLKLTLEFNVENVTKDFLNDYSEQDKAHARKALESALGYAIHRDNLSCSSIVHYKDGSVGVSLYEEIEIKREGAEESSWITIHIEDGNIDILLSDEKYALERKSIAKFPFYPVDEFLVKTQNMAQLKSLPPFLSDHLKKFDFEIGNFCLDNNETFKAYDAVWISEDWEVRSDYNWNQFRSKYLTVSLIYFFFNVEELSPLDKNLILPSRYDHKEKIDHSTVVKKIAALKDK